jgi:hypothetical protein
MARLAGQLAVMAALGAAPMTIPTRMPIPTTLMLRPTHRAGDGKPKDMLEAITQGLAKADSKVTETDEEKTAREAEEAAAAAAKADKHANGTPKKDAAGNELDDKGVIVKAAEKPKAKTSAELQLSKEQLAALKPESRQRFAEVINTLKTKEAEVVELTKKIEPLQGARDAIIGIMEATGTTSAQLSGLMEFNRMLNSEKPQDWEAALKLVEDQRAQLYQALGREPDGGGVDLLAEFPDLKQKVAEASLTREDALEIAQARRNKAAGDASAAQGRKTEEQRQATLKARGDAQNAITSWAAGLAKSDIDYKAKEERLLEQVDEVIKNYAPNQWLPTLQLIYKGLVVTKGGAPGPKGKQPIRPSGAKPGAKAPTNMYEAMWGGKTE